MKKLIKRIMNLTAASLLVVASSAIIFGGTAKALPWSPTATGLDHPGFNVFTGVPGYGDESDFVRGRVSGSSNDFTDPVNDSCNNGTQFSVRVYVHNAANQTLNNNGTGPGVAHDTKVKVSVPSTTANKLTGTISASNAASVNDTLTIDCNGKTMQLSYVNGSAIEQRMDGSTSPLSDSIVSTGALIGTHDVNGDVWGCFEQRVLVFLKVKVTEAPSQLPAVCTALVISQSNHTVTVKSVDFTANDAKVSNIRIDFGDGTVKTVKTTDLPISHTYTGNTSRKITATLLTDKGEVTSVNCAKTVSFTSQPTPTHLVNTGAGNIVGIFTATSLVGAFLHRKWSIRNSQ